jgi:hypothetical protein
LDIGNIFWRDKCLGEIKIGNTVRGPVNLIGELYLTNGSEIAEVFCLENYKNWR